MKVELAVAELLTALEAVEVPVEDRDATAVPEALPEDVPEALADCEAVCEDDDVPVALEEPELEE